MQRPLGTLAVLALFITHLFVMGEDCRLVRMLIGEIRDGRIVSVGLAELPDGPRFFVPDRLYVDGWTEEEASLLDNMTATFTCLLRGSRRGWWATTHRRITLMRVDSPRPLTPDEMATARRTLADVLADERFVDPRCIAALRAGEDHVVMPIWSGYVHNVISLTLAIIFVISLGWIPRGLAGRRRRKALAHGCCPGCGYDLRGQTLNAAGGRSCPECGMTCGG